MLYLATQSLIIFSFRLAAPQDDPLALRQLLWLQDELFVAVGSGLLPTTSTLLMLHPALDSGDTLAVRSADLTFSFNPAFFPCKTLKLC